ncbi:MAG: hypothetical protein GF347_05270, partial [Candidatus Moranbacteria bacterium]|nr:hypothetical protein [Candidatus Moranbacteria bacterium]
MLFLVYLKLFLTLILVFIVPGWLILDLFFAGRDRLSLIEKTGLSLPLSVTLINFIVLLLGRFNVGLNAFNLYLTLIFSVGVLALAYYFLQKKSQHNSKPVLPIKTFSRKNLIILSLISILISARFLALDIVPNNTDLGHHMYWVKNLEINEKIPDYNTSDVIVGEHIAFFVLSKLTGIDILTAFPVVFLMIIDLISFLLIFQLAKRISRKESIALISFAFIAVLYVIAAPFMKFVSGGVVGNTFGNLFIPSVLLSLFLSFRFNEKRFLALAIFLFVGIFYIHHLSTFLLIFIILSLVGSQILLELMFPYRKRFDFRVLKRWLRLFFSKAPLIVLTISAVFIGLIYTPHYIRHEAVETVVQTPDKDSHRGVSLNSFTSSIGEFRTLLGILGVVVFGWVIARNSSLKPQNKKQGQRNLQLNLNAALILGWL